MMARGNRRRALGRALIPLLLVLAACETPISDRLLAVNGPGIVLVFMYRDDNLSGAFNATTDVPVANAGFGLRMLGATVDGETAVTDTAGFAFAVADPGRYTVSIPAALLSDTLEMLSGTAEFEITARDTAHVNVAFAYRTVTPTEARTTPQNRRVWLSGVALNAPAAFGDSTVSVGDTSRAIRAVAVKPAALVAGDSVLFLGRLMTQDGQPVFEVLSQYIRGHVTVLPGTATTAMAASADGGILDANLVRVLNGAIADTTTNASGDRVLTVDDGSGPLQVLLSANQGWGGVNLYPIGATLDATGVLVPDPANNSVWLLKPRVRSDLLVF